MPKGMKDMMGGMGMEDMMMAMMMGEMSLGGGMGGMGGMGGGFGDLVDDLEDGDYDSDEINSMAKSMGLSKKETAEFKKDIRKQIEAAKKQKTKQKPVAPKKEEPQV